MYSYSFTFETVKCALYTSLYRRSIWFICIDVNTVVLRSTCRNTKRFDIIKDSGTVLTIVCYRRNKSTNGVKDIPRNGKNTAFKLSFNM